MSLLNSLLEEGVQAGVIPTSFPGTIYVNDVDGDDANDGQTEFDPVATLAQAISDVPDGGLIFIMPGSSGYTFANITVSKDITIFSPNMISLNGLLTASGGVNITLIGVFLQNLNDGSPMYDSGAAGSPALIVRDCQIIWGSIGASPAPGPGVTLYGFNHRAGSITIDNCDIRFQGNDSATSGVRALVYKSGANLLLTTTIKNTTINTFQGNPDLPVYTVFSASSGAGAFTDSQNNIINFTPTADNIDTLFYLGAASSGEFLLSNNDEYLCQGNNWNNLTINVFNLNNVSKQAHLTNFYCDYGLSNSDPLNGTTQVFNIGVTAAPTDSILAVGTVAAPANTIPGVITGPGTLSGSITNKVGQVFNTAGEITTIPVTINLTSGAPQVVYTVPAGRTFRTTWILIDGATAITGTPQITIGSTAGGNTNIMNAVPVNATLTSTTAQNPLPSNPASTKIAAGTAINAVATVTASAGTVSIRLVGILS